QDRTATGCEGLSVEFTSIISSLCDLGSNFFLSVVGKRAVDLMMLIKQPPPTHIHTHTHPISLFFFRTSLNLPVTVAVGFDIPTQVFGVSVGCELIISTLIRH